MENNYEQKYKKALDNARLMYDAGNNDVKHIVGQLFPELAESEDEKIRKRLITDFGTIGKKEWGGLEVKDILAWLEKQGEQSLANKVEPKYHEGDWITNGDYTWKIVEVKPLDYILQSQDGNVVDDTISHVDEQFHSFTIQDAKDGDVLYINNTVSESIMIYKSFNNGIIKKYASYNKFGFEGEHYLTLNDGYITPATKEQRDTLMKAMVDAGYEWSDKDRKLIKIVK